MKTYKVYFRHNEQLNTCYIQANDGVQAGWKLLSRFNYAKLLNIHELKLC